MQDPTSFTRRTVLKAASGIVLAGALPGTLLAQTQEQRRFDPRPGDWRTFEVVTRVNLAHNGPSRIWVPLPSVDTEWQRSLSDNWSGNAKTMRVGTDSHYGARYLFAEFDGSAPPVLEVASRVQTRDRAHDWRAPGAVATESAADLRMWLQPTDLLPTDGIVRKTALQITSGARSDQEKVQRIYDWIILNTFREPKVKGCGTGDIKTMLETGNFGGKCGDINGLFVGLARAAGVPARDVYGLRLVPSAFGYRELGGNPASLKGAQHCRSEVYLRKHGWVAMDPADVGKVMRLEAGTWIKDPDNPLVAPVKKALFGGWEGNWMGYNFAHDVRLPGSSAGKVGFLMYPQAQTNGEAYDPLEPDSFKYTITARVISA